jgi:hypothetical protein
MQRSSSLFITMFISIGLTVGPGEAIAQENASSSKQSSRLITLGTIAGPDSETTTSAIRQRS